MIGQDSKNFQNGERGDSELTEIMANCFGLGLMQTSLRSVHYACIKNILRVKMSANQISLLNVRLRYLLIHMIYSFVTIKVSILLRYNVPCVFRRQQLSQNPQSRV